MFRTNSVLCSMPQVPNTSPLAVGDYVAKDVVEEAEEEDDDEQMVAMSTRKATPRGSSAYASARGDKRLRPRPVEPEPKKRKVFVQEANPVKERPVKAVKITSSIFSVQLDHANTDP